MTHAAVAEFSDPSYSLGDPELDRIRASWERHPPAVSLDTIDLLAAADKQQQADTLQACREAVKAAWGTPQCRGGRPFVPPAPSYHLQAAELQIYFGLLLEQLPSQVHPVDLDEVVRRCLLG